MTEDSKNSQALSNACIRLKQKTKIGADRWVINEYGKFYFHKKRKRTIKNREKFSFHLQEMKKKEQADEEKDDDDDESEETRRKHEYKSERSF